VGNQIVESSAALRHNERESRAKAIEALHQVGIPNPSAGLTSTPSS